MDAGAAGRELQGGVSGQARWLEGDEEDGQPLLRRPGGPHALPLGPSVCQG